MSSRTVAIRQITTVVSQAMRENDTRVSCRTPVTAALTPELAIAYVRELSADVRAAVVLAADGRLLAGPEALAAPARELLAVAGDRQDVGVRTAGGVVLAARGPAHALVAAAGPHSLIGPSAIDARRAVDALGDAAPADELAPGRAGAVARDAVAAAPPDGGVLLEAAEAVISAARRAI